MKYRFIKKKKQSEDVSLQITSMADVFTILLVFLLKSFSTDVSKITPHESLVLPGAQISSPLTESLKLEVSKSLILFDDKPVTELTQFSFDPSDLETNGTPRSLNTVLIQQKRKDARQRYPQLMILADQDTPFSTIKKVLSSASNSGYEDFKLVVVEDN
jgi:biopolymer transport protein ExbD